MLRRRVDPLELPTAPLVEPVARPLREPALATDQAVA